MNAELNSIKGKKVLVIGDVMLDTYHIGDVKRISPEAPLPVVRVTRTYNVLGGAANVAKSVGTGLLAVCRQPAWQRPQRKHNAGDVR